MTHTCCNTLPRNTPGAGGSLVGTISFPGAQQILHVFGDSDYGAAGADGTMAKPYMTIAAAITAANALTPATDNRILILVWPMEGGYDESITLADDYVYLAGVSRDGCILTNSGTPLSVTAGISSVWNFTINGDATSVDEVIDISTGDAANYVEFHECEINCLANTNFIGIGAADTSYRFVDCVIRAAANNQYFHQDSVINDGGYGEFKGCTLVGGALSRRGNLRFYGCASESSEGVFIRGYNTGGRLRVQNCDFETGAVSYIIYVLNITELIVVDNRLSASAGPEITGSGTYPTTGAIIENNILSYGIDSVISHVNPVKRVGAAAVKDWYATLQDALTATTFDDCVLEMYADETLAAELTPPSQTFTIDGRGIHEIDYGVQTIITVDTGEDITFRDVTLTGRLILANAGTLSLLRVDLTGFVRIENNADPGSLVTITSSKLVAPGFFGAIRIRDNDTVIVVDKSFVKGGITGGAVAAVTWDAGVSNANLKCKNSTFVHPSGGANSPFSSAGGVANINFRAHHCGFNSDPTLVVGPPTFTNLVAAGQQQNTFDTNVDWS